MDFIRACVEGLTGCGFRGPSSLGAFLMTSMVRQATGADLGTAARVLARAFMIYPWTRWSIPEEDYEQRLERLQYLYLGHALAHGLVLVDEQLRSIAAFLPPDAPEPGPDMQDEVLELLGSRVTALADLRLPQPRVPAWNLATVGVDPVHQGRGLGTAVASEGLTRIDREAGTVVLETSDERNVRLYGRLGFLVTDTTMIPEGPTVYSMTRAPQRP